MIEIISLQGEVKQIAIQHFPALDGWDIQSRFYDFAASTDKAFRRAYTLEVLNYCRVIVGGREIPLLTDALIDNHLESWTNIELVFNAILRHNGIEPDTHADRESYWSKAGAQMAISFIAEASKLMGPALEFTSKLHDQE